MCSWIIEHHHACITKTRKHVFKIRNSKGVSCVLLYCLVFVNMSAIHIAMFNIVCTTNSYQNDYEMTIQPVVLLLPITKVHVFNILDDPIKLSLVLYWRSFSLVLYMLYFDRVRIINHALLCYLYAKRLRLNR